MKPGEIKREGADRRTTTRYAVVTLDPGTGGFYRESRAFLDRANVTSVRVHYANVLDDGTILGLYELHGDEGAIRREADSLSGVIGYDVIGANPTYLYLHEQPREPAQTLLTVLQSAPIVVD